MGWSSGSRLMSAVITATTKAIPDEEVRKEFYKEVINAFEDADWDTQDECMGEDDAFDTAINELAEVWGDQDGLRCRVQIPVPCQPSISGGRDEDNQD